MNRIDVFGQDVLVFEGDPTDAALDAFFHLVLVLVQVSVQRKIAAEHFRTFCAHERWKRVDDAFVGFQRAFAESGKQ